MTINTTINWLTFFWKPVKPKTSELSAIEFNSTSKLSDLHKLVSLYLRNKKEIQNCPCGCYSNQSAFQSNLWTKPIDILLEIGLVQSSMLP